MDTHHGHIPQLWGKSSMQTPHRNKYPSRASKQSPNSESVRMGKVEQDMEKNNAVTQLNAAGSMLVILFTFWGMGFLIFLSKGAFFSS